jgi:hypothetical protein
LPLLKSPIKSLVQPLNPWLGQNVQDPVPIFHRPSIPGGGDFCPPKGSRFSLHQVNTSSICRVEDSGDKNESPMCATINDLTPT